MIESSTGGRSLSRQLIAWYLTLTGITLAVVIWKAPHFSYSLDDPYIHLALAQNILHGHYGINASETVSPASSVLWPFLLAPLSETPLREWVPFGWNILFSIATCMVLGRFLASRLQQCGMGRLERGLFALVVVVAANLVGLTFTGMEHSLQIFLIVLCSMAVVHAYDGENVPTYCLVAAALAPAVRYEDLAVTVAICAVVWIQKRRTAAIVTLCVSMLPAIALGLFFRMHNLSFLPNSILYKGNAVLPGTGTTARFGPLAGLLATFRENAINYVVPHQPSRMAITGLVVALAGLFWINRKTRPVRYLVPAFAAALAMMLFGPYGWFYRYDVYLRLFVFLIVLCVLIETFPRYRWLVWGCALLAGCGFVPALARTPFSSIQIARQQYEMHRFTSEFAHENVAVNDLGWVSFDVNGRFYVLDLVGLGSNETLRVPNKNVAWLDGVAREHGIALVMIYPSWFAKIPPDWILLGVLRQNKLALRGYQDHDEVSFYATTPANADTLIPELRRFAYTLQPEMSFAPTVR